MNGALTFSLAYSDAIEELVKEKKTNRGSNLTTLLQREVAVYCNIASLYGSGNDVERVILKVFFCGLVLIIMC